jgi:hypothetical protein
VELSPQSFELHQPAPSVPEAIAWPKARPRNNEVGIRKGINIELMAETANIDP